ncbi:MAG: hydroxymethylglutaryl-CoA reductase, degradative [Candidatus Aenigmarchaeota archaeon]|nr:hydroxymethylglutaryl-CoA reductase, degradative [Candidatus Aenigmarchaeota archaeon]
MKSDISGFHKLSVKKRLKVVGEFSSLSKDDLNVLKHNSALGELANKMIENVISTTQLPLGIATNFRINNKDYLIPMAIEETSVVAAASHAAKLARPAGFTAESDEPVMIGQIQLTGIKNADLAKKKILDRKKEIMKRLENKDSILVKLGGGLKDLEIREIDSARGKMIIVHLIIDVRDAMGANAVNTYCEAIAPFLEEITGGRSVLKIISNLAVHRLVRATATWKKEVLDEALIEGMLDAAAFAGADKFRAATHNKGVMNGVDAVLIATGNDWRAVEAGAHAYATTTGEYLPLTWYEKNKRGDLVGHIELPMAVGIVGGITSIHPVAKVSLKILQVKTSRELGELAACVGLANNFAALRAMVKEGISKGHMKLHATNIAASVGAHDDEIDAVAKRLVAEGNITMNRAHEILKQMRIEMTKENIEKILHIKKRNGKNGKKKKKNK